MVVSFIFCTRSKKNSDSTVAASLAANHFQWHFIIDPAVKYFKQAAIKFVRSRFLASGRVCMTKQCPKSFFFSWKAVYLFVEGRLDKILSSSTKLQRSRDKKKSPRSSPIFLCVCLLRTEPYASPWTCVQVSFSFQKGTKLKSTRIKHGQKLKEKILLGFLTKISVMLKEFGNLINVSGMKKDCHICSATVITEEEFFTEIRQKNFVAQSDRPQSQKTLKRING